MNNRMGSSPLQNLIQNTDKVHKTEREKEAKHENSGTEKKMSLVKSSKNQQASKTVGESVPAAGQERKKATYYVRKDLIKGLKMLGAETEKDLSQLVEEAIEKLLKEKTVSIK